MYNNHNIPLTQVLKSRFDQFFSIKSKNIFYCILQYAWIVVFAIPFFIESIAEFLTLTIISVVGNLGEFIFKPLFIIWIPIGFVLGALYFLISCIFYACFIILTLPNFIMDLNQSNS